MARSYSLDLRERVVSAVLSGETCRSVARTFNVSVASVVKWSQRKRETGSAAASHGLKRRFGRQAAGAPLSYPQNLPHIPTSPSPLPDSATGLPSEAASRR